MEDLCGTHPVVLMLAEKGMNITVDHADYVWFVAPDTAKGKPWMMNILHFSQSVNGAAGLLCSLLLHGLIFLAFILAFFRSSARYVSCTGDRAVGRNYRGSLLLHFRFRWNRSTESAVTEEESNKLRTDNNVLSLKTVTTIEITRKKKSSDGEKKRHVHLVR